MLPLSLSPYAKAVTELLRCSASLVCAHSSGESLSRYMAAWDAAERRWRKAALYTADLLAQRGLHKWAKAFRAAACRGVLLPPRGNTLADLHMRELCHLMVAVLGAANATSPFEHCGYMAQALAASERLSRASSTFASALYHSIERVQAAGGDCLELVQMADELTYLSAARALREALAQTEDNAWPGN